MQTFIYLFAIGLFLFSTGCSAQPKIDQTFPQWQQGELEIHHIYTGRGESNFLILPDGTSLLIDAGDWDPKDYPKMCDALPDSSRRAGEWIARYIKRVNPYQEQVDYLLISHFHNDHTGDSSNPVPMTEGRNPDYKLTGIAEVGESIRFKQVFDRGYPDYQYPLPIQDPDVDNYRAFINWQRKQFGLRQEAFEVGKCNQITLQHEPETYASTFSIRNLAASGIIWSGKGDSCTCYYDLNPINLLPNKQNENTKSIGLRIDYGPFRYYTGGDISGNLSDKDGNPVNLEEKIAEACGPVDVCKVNHHAYRDAMTEGFIRQIQARHYIIPVWDYEHIQPSVMSRMASKQLYDGERMIFPTAFPISLQQKYASADWMPSVCPETGHIVIKVSKGGNHYTIYVLSAEDENMRVKAVYTP